jgi:hypothetical protein
MKKIYSIILFSIILFTCTYGQHTINSSYRYYANPGIVNIAELTGATGMGHTDGANEKYFIRITDIIGYQIDRNFFCGIGAGYSKYDNDQFIPVFIDIRYSLYLKNFTPYIFSDGGLLVDPSNLIAGTKMFLNPGIGISRSVTTKCEVSFASGILVQMGDISQRASFYNFKLGIIFRKNPFRLYKAERMKNHF